MADVVDYTFARVWRMPSTTHLLGCQAQGSSLTLRIGNASGKFRNCIVVGNANQNGPSGVGGDYVSKAIYTLCDVAGLTGAGCKTEADSAKVFKKPASGDYHLRSGSPAVNAGSNQDWMSDALDLDGASRIFGRQVDMGCYEFPNGLGTVIFMQ